MKNFTTPNYHSKPAKEPFSAKQVFLFLSKNGLQFTANRKETRQLIYANMIWLATFSGLLVYGVGIGFFGDIATISFWLGVGFFSIVFILYHALVKSGFIFFSKHWLVISTYLMVVFFDSLTANRTYVFMCMFAFLPTAFNIFSLTKNWLSVLVYCLVPLFYSLLTQVSGYTYFSFSKLPADLVFQRSFNLTLSFLLMIVFSAYMVFNSIARQQKQTLQRLTLQSTLDNSDSAIWSVDHDFKLTVVNTRYLDSIAKLFGITDLAVGVNLKNHPLWERFPDAFKQQYYDVFDGKPVLHEEKVNEQFFEIHGVPIIDADDKVRGATFASRNITEKKRQENSLVAAKLQAEEAGNTKARFLSNMSHELRTPLNGILGIIRILKDEKILPEQETHLKTLQDLSEHTLQLINNILDFAKIEAGKATLENKSFNLTQFIEKLSSIFQGTARLKGIRFEIEHTENTNLYLSGDEMRLSQVLINLIGNAFKFTENGSVKLRCSVRRLNEGKADISFAISDTGIGIKKENLSKIFESFNQADGNTTRLFGGTGLGLSIGEKILNLMGSKLQVESKYGEGSVFSFTINMDCSDEAASVNNYPVHEEDLSGVKILLAEDNKVNQMVVVRLLSKMQANVSVVGNGKEACEFEQMNEQNIILMDLDMPVMDGYESSRIIKKQYPGKPILALTAASFDDMDNYLSQQGFDGVVQKPFVLDDLLSKIISLVRKHA